MRPGRIIAVIGALLLFSFAFINVLWVFVVNSSVAEKLLFVILSAIILFIGAIPGLIIDWVSRSGSPRSAALEESPPVEQ